TRRTPIVVAALSSPIEYGLTTSLARPRGNLTGLTDNAGPEVAAKALEFLTEAVPAISRVAYTATTTMWNGAMGQILREGTHRRGIPLLAAPMDGPSLEAQYVETFRASRGQAHKHSSCGKVTS